MSTVTFSRRTDHDARPNRLAHALDARRRAGSPVLDMSVSNPSSAGFTASASALSALGDARAATYEPHAAGHPDARAALARHLRSLGEVVREDRLFLSASTSEAYAWLFKLLCDPGDEVIIPVPGYPLFDHLAALENVRVVPVPCAYDGTWHLQPHALRAAITPRTRAIILVSPNNPTGQYLKRHERDLLAQLGLPIIADEVFFHHPLQKPADAVHAVGAGPLVFTLGGLSKLCAMPQLKLGWIHVDGDEALVARAVERLELVADTFLSVGTPVQVALPLLLEDGARLRAETGARLKENLAHLRAAVAGTPVTLLRAEGGWSAVLRLPALLTDEEWALALLEKDGVSLHPGYFFDVTIPACVVVSLLTPRDIFQRGVRAILQRAGA